jgi:hypothetical protein
MSAAFTVKVTTDALNVRKGSGTSYEKTSCIRDCSNLHHHGGKERSGRLKSGLGWISLAYTFRTDGKALSLKKSVDEVAREVIAGRWGNGSARSEALAKADYDYAKVQSRINELLR